MRNLIDNALKYGDAKQQISIYLYEEDNNNIISVHNYGRAILSNEKEKIFTPFYRSGVHRNSQHGFGLGLTICQKIVVAHGGKLLLKSDSSETIFTIELPFSFN